MIVNVKTHGLYIGLLKKLRKKLNIEVKSRF